MARPSRRVRESATTIRYWGARILPRRISLILTATKSYSTTHVMDERREGGGEHRHRLLEGTARVGRGPDASRYTAHHCARSTKPLLDDRAAQQDPRRCVQYPQVGARVGVVHDQVGGGAGDQAG